MRIIDLMQIVHILINACCVWCKLRIIQVWFYSYDWSLITISHSFNTDASSKFNFDYHFTCLVEYKILCLQELQTRSCSQSIVCFIHFSFLHAAMLICCHPHSPYMIKSMTSCAILLLHRYFLNGIKSKSIVFKLKHLCQEPLLFSMIEWASSVIITPSCNK